MRSAQQRSLVRWYVMAAGVAAAQAELTTLGVPYLRSSGTLTWPDDEAEVFVYEFSLGPQIGPGFAAVDRIRAAGHWLDGWYQSASGFPS